LKGKEITDNEGEEGNTFRRWNTRKRERRLTSPTKMPEIHCDGRERGFGRSKTRGPAGKRENGELCARSLKARSKEVV